MDKKIIWTHQAEADLRKAFIDLLEYSESQTIASRITAEIYASVSILATNPEIYKLDPLKKNNNGISVLSKTYFQNFLFNRYRGRIYYKSTFRTKRACGVLILSNNKNIITHYFTFNS